MSLARDRLSWANLRNRMGLHGGINQAPQLKPEGTPYQTSSRGLGLGILDRILR